MNLYEIAQIYEALDTFMELTLPFQKTWQIMMVKESMKQWHNFYLAEYEKLLKQYADKDENGNIKTEGETVLFGDDESNQECLKKVAELRSMESDIDIKPIFLTEKDIGNQRISGKCCELLQGIINIENE